MCPAQTLCGLRTGRLSAEIGADTRCFGFSRPVLRPISARMTPYRLLSARIRSQDRFRFVRACEDEVGWPESLNHFNLSIIEVTDPAFARSGKSRKV
jgi:hypothetical protein